MILIISNKEDVHPTPVIDVLTRRGVPVFRLNTEALLTDYEFAWWGDSAHCDFHLKNIRNGLEVTGADITALWDRRPEKPEELPLKSTPEIDSHNLSEALGFLVFLRYYLKDIPSIGSIVEDRAAASKMLQHKVALEAGFAVPETCYSNLKKPLIDLASKHGNILLKSIENGNVWQEESSLDYVFYAQRVPSGALSSIPDEAFSQTVSFAQEYVEKAFELRVTVVGDKLFACRIDSQAQDDDTGKIDWRQGYGHGIKWSRFDLPEDIAEKCLVFLKKMNLNFGCFDFIVSPSGEYVFLECNPNGQWLWVEIETGLPISEAIAEWLAEKG